MNDNCINTQLSPVQSIKGVGPKKTAKLHKMGMFNIEDVLYSFPREYEDRRNVKYIAQLVNEEQVLICAKVLAVRKSKYVKNRKQMLRVLVEDKTGKLEIVFFNASYYYNAFTIDKKYFFYGRVSGSFDRKQMIHPDFSEVNDEDIKAIMPIYPLTEGISQNERRRIQKNALQYIDCIDEYLPDEILKRNRLCGIKYALKEIHSPQSFDAVKVAKFRLIFEELLILQTGLLMIKNRLQKDLKGIVFSKGISVEKFIERLPFTLTDAQKRTINEIINDMESQKVMNRLIQGDVGSGKTVVAAVAVYKSVLSSYQAVVMAPTEILAQQHFKTFKKFFNAFDIRIEFLSGSTSKKSREEILAELETGDIDVLIGTHAVIQDNVKFFKLGLVITDEQHRFGVNQRAALSDKGIRPDVLVMTATPIPRTLALILYGDLDISIIDEMPAGRKRIKTLCLDMQNRIQAYELIKQKLSKGRQAYIVAPLIEDSENLNTRSVESLFEELESFFSGYKIAILHGNLKQAEKDEIMGKYINGEISVLISTVVIEVGIDVPNATVMVIENCERFGLAQLHQLRGRVGRGQEQSFCILINGSNNEISQRRIQIMEETDNGFLIAEEDLKIRGPGEFFGTRQHGIPEMKIANLFKHIKILSQVQKEAKIVLKSDPFLEKKDNNKFKLKILSLFKDMENLNL